MLASRLFRYFCWFVVCCRVDVGVPFQVFLRPAVMCFFFLFFFCFTSVGLGVSGFLGLPVFSCFLV